MPSLAICFLRAQWLLTMGKLVPVLGFIGEECGSANVRWSIAKISGGVFAFRKRNTEFNARAYGFASSDWAAN